MQSISRQAIIDHIQNSPAGRFQAVADVKFILHTPTQPEGVHVQLNDDVALVAAGFNPANAVRFTIHGWRGDKGAAVNTVPELLAIGNINHFIVDWSAGASTINYVDARNRVPAVAELVANFIRFLVRNGSSFDQIVTIGHSLGGQMAAMAGKYIPKGVGEISACICLDPAGPLFSTHNASDRASADDCNYVQVIHTNVGRLGFREAIGDADFYPNGGRKQPGCGLDPLGTCSHARSYELFRESIASNTPFEAWHCLGTVDEVISEKCQTNGLVSIMMGDPIDFNSRGIFYSITAGKSPFITPLVDVE